MAVKVAEYKLERKMSKDALSYVWDRGMEGGTKQLCMFLCTATK